MNKKIEKSITSDKTLKDKAIDIKGRSYVLVSDRVIFFNDTYSNGAITTKLLTTPDAERVTMIAKVTPDLGVPERFFTGHSQATWGDGMVNKTAALENCETSAVGRALAMMGIGVIDSIASADEINKATNQEKATRPMLDIKCPKCGNPLVEGKTRAGKTLHKCSTNKYENGKASGCDYVNWDPTGREAEARKRATEGNPMTVEEYEGYS